MEYYTTQPDLGAQQQLYPVYNEPVQYQYSSLAPYTTEAPVSQAVIPYEQPNAVIPYQDMQVQPLNALSFPPPPPPPVARMRVQPYHRPPPSAVAPKEGGLFGHAFSKNKQSKNHFI
eukprot:NODE_4885_length_619_cov_130.892982_g4206_i0.p1 GENE.NODE_4885_length_619_cov_130.892982_g4206_i0~~NODE_4885_length_619_cov_130.892982_g4206_i0.p1  ORF type:complete len:133 (+),score=13.82 NODE_4885_length_619_cov_130.892982_g4206_i0:49-399(+)